MNREDIEKKYEARSLPRLREDAQRLRKKFKQEDGRRQRAEAELDRIEQEQQVLHKVIHRKNFPPECEEEDEW